MSRSRTSRTAARIAVLCVLLGVAAAGCGGGQGAAADKTLTVLINGAPQSINPALSANGANGTWPAEAAYDSLINKTVDGTYEPGLATQWSYGPRNMTFTMKLRTDVKFSDGQPMTAKAVAASINYYRKANGPLSGALSAISKVTATAPDEVKVTMSTPLGILPELFSQLYSGYIIGPRGVRDPDFLNEATDGTGPYQLDSAETVIGSRYTYSKNRHHSGEAPYSKVVINVVADPNAALAAMRTGKADVSQGDVNTATAAEDAGLQIINAPTGVLALFLIDRGGEVVPALGDLRVRQALNHATNRPAITSALLGRFGTPTNQPTIPGYDAYLESLEEMYEYDPSRAHTLLAEAGYRRGFPVTILTRTAPEIDGRIVQAVAAEWEKLGIDVKIRQAATFDSFLEDWLSKKYAIAMFGLGAAPIYVNSLYDFLPDAILNPFHSRNPRLDSLFGDLNEKSGAAAEQVARNIETVLVEQAWLAPLTAVHDVYYAAEGADGVEMSSRLWVPNLRDWRPADG